MLFFSHISTISKGIWWRGNATVWVAIFQLIQLYFLAHWLPPEAFGVYAILRTLIGFGGYFTDAGMYNALLYNPAIEPALFTTLYALSIGVGLTLWAMFAGLAPWITSFYSMPALDEALGYIGMTLFCSSIGGHYKAILQRDLQFKILAVIDTGSHLLGTAVTLIYAYFSPDVMALVLGYLTKVGVASSAHLWVAFPRHPLVGQLTSKGLKYYLNYAKYQLPERMFTYFNANADVLIVGKLLGEELLGAYELFKQFLRRAEHLINPLLDHVFSPLITANHRSGKPIASLYMGMTAWSALVLFPVYVGLFLSAQEFVENFFGSHWLMFTALFQWLCLYYILHSFVQHIGTLWVGINRPDLGFYWNLCWVFILPAAVFFSAKSGINQVAITLTILMLMQGGILYFTMIKPHMGVGLRSYLSAVLKPMRNTLLAFLPLWGMSRWLWPGASKLNTVLLPGLVLYALLVYAFERTVLLRIAAIVKKKNIRH